MRSEFHLHLDRLVTRLLSPGSIGGSVSRGDSARVAQAHGSFEPFEPFWRVAPLRVASSNTRMPHVALHGLRSSQPRLVHRPSVPASPAFAPVSAGFPSSWAAPRRWRAPVAQLVVALAVFLAARTTDRNAQVNRFSFCAARSSSSSAGQLQAEAEDVVGRDHQSVEPLTTPRGPGRPAKVRPVMMANSPQVLRIATPPGASRGRARTRRPAGSGGRIILPWRSEEPRAARPGPARGR